MKRLSSMVKDLIKDTSKRLFGPARRKYHAEITLEYFDGNARKAEREMGWGRACIQKGLGELKSGIMCLDNYRERGRKRTEDKIPGLKEAIISLAEPQTQADPALKSSLTYTRITAKSMREALITDMGFNECDLPTEVSIGNILNRMGYNLKRVQKSKPVKKIKEVDQIFENTWERNRESDDDPETLRISIDAKAKVDVGEFSRKGKSREKNPKQAADHDMNPESKLVPFGILNTLTGLLTIFFCTSVETSDFIVDCLEAWWKQNSINYPNIKTLTINLDNGPNCSSRRTQFIRRMVEFAEKSGLQIHLVYYPPYHSKYNPIERCWGILEEHWNGEILNSIDKTLEWASTMTWKGIKPIVKFCGKVYKKGVKLTKQEMRAYEDRILRSYSLPKWDLIINPLSG